MKYFILMADIIGSSRKNAEELMPAFSKVVEEVNKKYRKQIISPLTITLGDEFQGVVSGLREGIAIIYSLDEALLTSRDTFYLRYALHYGDIATGINRNKAHGMLGDGLTAARETLEAMKKSGREVTISGLGEDVENRLNLAFFLYRSLYNDWYPKDRQTVFDFLRHKDYKKVAALHDRDNSSMWRKEKSLKIDEFHAARELINLIADEH